MLLRTLKDEELKEARAKWIELDGKKIPFCQWCMGRFDASLRSAKDLADHFEAFL